MWPSTDAGFDSGAMNPAFPENSSWPSTLPRIVRKRGSLAVERRRTLPVEAKSAPDAWIALPLERRRTVPEDFKEQDQAVARRLSAQERFRRSTVMNDTSASDNAVTATRQDVGEQLARAVAADGGAHRQPERQDAKLPVSRQSGQGYSARSSLRAQPDLPSDIASTPRAMSVGVTMSLGGSARKFGSSVRRRPLLSARGWGVDGATKVEVSAPHTARGTDSTREMNVEEFAHINRLVCIAKRCSLAVDVVRKEWNVYRSLVGPCNRDGYLSIETFLLELRRRCHLGVNDDIPFHLLPDDFDTTVSFEAYMAWWARMQYAEESIEPAEREIRQLARDHDMNILDMERLRSLFDGFDSDGNGGIDEEEFKELLRKSLGARRKEDVSLLTFTRYWKQADKDKNGYISFKEFMLWYCGVFRHEGFVD